MTFSNFRNYGIAMFRMIPNDFVNMIHDIPSLSNYRDYGLVSRDWDWNHTFPTSHSLAANPLILLCSNHFLFGSVLGFPTGLTAIETSPVQRVCDNDVFSTSVTLELSNAFFSFPDVSSTISHNGHSKIWNGYRMDHRHWPLPRTASTEMNEWVRLPAYVLHPWAVVSDWQLHGRLASNISANFLAE